MKNICASIIAVRLLFGGIQACVPTAGAEILKMGSMTIPKRFSEQIIEIVVETPIESIIEHLNDAFCR